MSVDFELTDEGSIDNLLGCKIVKDDHSNTHITQLCLKKIMLESLILKNGCRRHSIPITNVLLNHMYEEQPCVETWNCRLTYMTQITNQEISHAANLLAQCIHDQHLVHEQAIKHLAGHLY